MPASIPILHFNDVYRVRQTDRKSGATIGADQFAARIDAIRQGWGGESPEVGTASSEPSQKGEGGDGTPDKDTRDWLGDAQRERRGLVLFSGDVWNPSVESSVTRGEHLVPVMNAIGVDCAVLGNHDWDFGYPHLTTLMRKCNFPWLFSNVVDTTAASASESAQKYTEEPQEGDAQVGGTLKHWVTNVGGVRVGCVGLVEKEWIATVPSFPSAFHYRSMIKVALDLSRTLRDPEGQYKCEIIIALTHCRLPNDIDFANEANALLDPPDDEHGVDLVLGGHDHFYYVGKGAASFEGEEFERNLPGVEKDEKTFVVKSGTDFHDLSEIELVLTDKAEGKVRARRIQSLNVKRHSASSSDPTLPHLKALMDDLLSKISKSTGQPIAYSLTEWDTRSDRVRTAESALGSFIADILMVSYEETLRERDNRGELNERRSKDEREVDCAIICGGSLRGDSLYPPGRVALGDLLEIMPFEDSVVCKLLTGQHIWDALENGLSMYPKQEGRFPQVAGLAVKYDSRKPPGSRLISVHLVDIPLDGDDEELNAGKRMHFDVHQNPDGTSVEVRRPMLSLREELDLKRQYRVVTREYMADGYDGFEALKGGSFLIDHENGQLMSTLVRKFLLGASYIHRMKQMKSSTSTPDTHTKGTKASNKSDGHNTLSRRTKNAIERARLLAFSPPSSPQPVAPQTPRRQTGTDGFFGVDASEGPMRMVVDQSPGGIRDALHVGANEHHSQHDKVSKRFAGRSNTSDDLALPQTPVKKGSRAAAAAAGAPKAGSEAAMGDGDKADSEHLPLDKDLMHHSSDDLAVVCPMVDGRLVDVARQE